MWGRRTFSHTDSYNPALLSWDGLCHGALASEPVGRGGGVQTGRRNTQWKNKSNIKGGKVVAPQRSEEIA